MQMGKIVWHIFYKEWIKTRWTYLAALVLGLATVFYVFIRVENGMERFGAKTYMLKVLYDNPPLIYYRMLLYVPLLIAASVGVTQYLPETVNRRIRLMLHLPVANTRWSWGWPSMALRRSPFPMRCYTDCSLRRALPCFRLKLRFRR